MNIRKIVTLTIIIYGAVVFSSGCSFNKKTQSSEVVEQPIITVAPSQGEGQTSEVDPLATKVADASSNNNQAGKNKAQTIVDSMTLEQKVGQLFFVRCPDSKPVAAIKKYHIGSYILFARDFEGKSKQTVIANINNYQEAADYPMLIGVDEEGGTVTRVSRYTAFRSSRFQSPQALYKAGGMDAILNDCKEKDTLLASLGINVNFAPVCDISTNSSDFMYKRSFGKNAQETGTYVGQVVSKMSADNMGSVMKHFPGYGNNVDTHTGIAIDNRAYDSFVSNDFVPFTKGIQAGADSILVSHNIVKCMDANYPASLSEKVHNIIRTKLNYDGVVMTDDLAMDAVQKYSDDKVAVLAIKAGNDMAIVTDYQVQIPAVVDAVNNGTLSQERINDAAVRVINWKIKLGLIK